ncbi:MAG: MFS transporter [Patulibacter sp.]|nr:MFS transporter [Patulibacter sp.]
MVEPPPQPGSSRRAPLLAVLMAATAAYALSQTLVIPALVTLTAETGTDPATASWLITAFLISSAVATPIAGRLGDLYGARRVLVVVLVLFAAGALLAATAQSIGPMIAGRAIAGVSGGAFPLAFAIVRGVLPSSLVPKSLATLSAVFGLGGAIGLPLSGLIVDYTSDVRLVFWIGLLALPIAAAVLVVVPRATVDRGASRSIDWLGSLLFAGGLAVTLLAITQSQNWGWGSAPFLLCAVAGPLVLVGFVAYERRQPNPLVDIALLSRRPMLMTNVVTVLIGLSTFACFVLVPALASAPRSTGYGLGLSVSVAGLLLVPHSLASVVGSQLAGHIGARRGYRVVLTLGVAMITISFAAMTFARHDWLPVMLLLTILGFGVGLSIAALTNIVVAESPESHVGIATGINALVRNVGAATGAAFSALVLSLSLLPSGLPTDGAYTVAFVSSTLIAGAAVAVSLVLHRLRSDGGPAPVVGT